MSHRYPESNRLRFVPVLPTKQEHGSILYKIQDIWIARDNVLKDIAKRCFRNFDFCYPCLRRIRNLVNL